MLGAKRLARQGRGRGGRGHNRSATAAAPSVVIQRAASSGSVSVFTRPFQGSGSAHHGWRAQEKGARAGQKARGPSQRGPPRLSRKAAGKDRKLDDCANSAGPSAPHSSAGRHVRCGITRGRRAKSEERATTTNHDADAGAARAERASWPGRAALPRAAPSQGTAGEAARDACHPSKDVHVSRRRDLTEA